MPYCAKCNYWIRNQLPVKTGVACVNCGKSANGLEVSVFTVGLLEGFSAVFGIVLAVAGLTLTAVIPAYGGILLFLIGVGIMIWAIIRQANLDAAAAELRKQERVPNQIFNEIRQNREILAVHAKEIRDVLEAEAKEAGSERAVHRQELLRGALANRDAQIRLLDAELWTRDVQLWLNQLEGFLASKLSMLGSNNAAELCDTLAALVEAGHVLQAQGSELDLNGIMPQRALRVLQDCLATAPELEERVKDARALAVVGDGEALDPILAPGGSWLHWLQEAIPTIELLPSEFTEDEEYLRVQTELRLLRDGVKYGDGLSLDRPSGSLNRGSIDADRVQDKSH